MTLLPNTPKNEPEQIAVGDTVEWTRQLDDYSAATYTLKYVLRNESNIIKFDATAQGAFYFVSLTTATTALWKAGMYAVAAYVVNAGGTVQKQVPVAFPRMVILPNLADNPNGVPVNTFAERGLVSIEATILQLTTRTVETATVNGQEYTLANIADLFLLRERFKSEVARETAQSRLNAGMGAGNKVAIRFKPLTGAGYPPYPRVPWQ